MTNEQLADLIRKVDVGLSDKIDRFEEKLGNRIGRLEERVSKLEEKVGDVATVVRVLNKDVQTVLHGEKVVQ